MAYQAQLYSGRPDMVICYVDGCERRGTRRGLCNVHRIRLKKFGDTLPGVAPQEFHKMSDTAIYRVWKNMKLRCYDKSNNSYNRYGGRGIKVCNQWVHSFMTFHEDMGDIPFKGAQIDRIDNNSGYSPDNCRWTTNTENARNRSSTKLTMEKADEIRRVYSLGGITMKQVAAKFGVSASLVWYIVNNKGWL